MWLRKTRRASLPPPWTCPTCGLPHRFATCWDVIPFAECSEMTKEERAVRFIGSMQESLARRLAR